MNKIVLVVLVLAVILRLPLLTGSFWMDEAAQALESVRPWQQQLEIVNDFQPPLMHVLIHLVQYVGRAEWWLRLWGAVIPGVLTVYITYRIGRSVVSEKLGVIAALLVATSSLHIFFSQELRPYALPALFAAFTWMLLLTNKTLTRKQQVFFVLASAAGLYSTYLYPCVLIGQTGFQFFSGQKKRWHIVLLGLCSLLLFLPWFPSFLDQLQAGQQLRTDLPGWENVVSTPQLKALPLTFGKFFYGVINIDVSPVFAIWPILVIVLLGFNLLFNRKQNPPINKRFVFGLLWWVFGSIFAAWLVSFWVPVLQPKRVLFALPAFYLLLSYLFVLYLDDANPVKKVLSYVGLSILFSINLFGLGRYYSDPLLQREDWRGLFVQIESLYPRENSIAVFAFPNKFAPVDWYAPEYPFIATGELTTTATIDLQSQFAGVTAYQNVLIFDYLRDLTDPDNKTIQAVQNYGFQEAGLLDSPGIGFVRVYSKP